jgi:hypothetical protein
MCTESGQPILAPEEAAAGDFVCMLWNCPMRAILRKEEEHFVLIGECYADELRDGISQDKLREGRYQTVEFDIY